MIGTTGRRLAAALLGAVLVVASVGACSDDTAAPPVATVTKTITGALSTSAAAPSSTGPARTSTSADAAKISAAFASFSKSLAAPVGVAIAPVGGGQVVTLGDQSEQVAWSTIKVPLALAAERRNGRSAAERSAIVDSDNAAAEALWSSLGGGTEAASAVTAVLREGGDETTVVPAQQLRAGFTIFGQTRWTLTNAATFGSHLPCLRGSGHVIELMGQVAGNQQWGVEIMRQPTATAVKGGWGPSAGGGYLVRQLGLITYRDGRQAAVAMSTYAPAASMDSGIAVLNRTATWLGGRLAALPRGKCS